MVKPSSPHTASISPLAIRYIESPGSPFRIITVPAGTVRAFDVRSGESLWTFDPIPRSSDDPASAGDARTLDGVETHAARADHNHILTGP